MNVAKLPTLFPAISSEAKPGSTFLTLSKDLSFISYSDRHPSAGRLLPLQLPLGSSCSVLELWQHLEPFLGAARQYHLVVGEFQRIVGDDNQASAHAQEATDRQYDVRLLAVRAN